MNFFLVQRQNIVNESIRKKSLSNVQNKECAHHLERKIKHNII